LVRNRAPTNWPRESVEDGNHQLDGDQTLDILLGFAMVHVSMQGLEMNRKELIKMDFLRYRHVFICLLLAILAGCTQQQNSQDLKEQTAQATAEVKHDAEAVAAGISEGWSSDKQLDLNTATKDQLLSLPGMTAAEADRVIAGRPYNEPGEVVTRRIKPKTEYDKIADRVTAKK